MITETKQKLDPCEAEEKVFKCLWERRKMQTVRFKIHFGTGLRAGVEINRFSN